MCGIVGYIGERSPQDVIYSGLARLEYRGYDSSGIAVHSKVDGKTHSIKAPGKLKELKKFWNDITMSASIGIGHTRWATHGEVNKENAHPHRVGPITIVHNGIIENHFEIRTDLKKQNVKFASETDSELFAHLVFMARKSGASLHQAVEKSFNLVRGSSAFVVMDEESPGTIVVAKNGPPLVIGLGKNENIVASDVPALLEYTRSVYYLRDNELAVLRADGVNVFTPKGERISIQATEISWELDAIDKQGYAHYMLKEIFEQPQSVTDTVGAWLDTAHKKFTLQANSTTKIPGEDRPKLSHADICNLFEHATNVQIVACGSAWHAGVYGQNLIEKIAKVSARIELASEFRYRDPVLRSSDLGLVVSQSGETADTLAAVKLMKQAGMKVLAICNVRDSSIARECDAVFYTNAGIEIGVASTKAFLTQMVMFSILAAAIGAAKKSISSEYEQKWVDALVRLPKHLKDALGDNNKLQTLALKYIRKKGFLFLGRDLNHAVALEGALKLKEIAYVHAEGYPAGELKHGPIAMVEPEMLILAIAPETSGALHGKSISNFQEVRARKGAILGLGASNDQSFQSICDDYVSVVTSEVAEILPIISTVYLQLFSYHMAVALGAEVDQPRNLAKSVTVE